MTPYLLIREGVQMKRSCAIAALPPMLLLAVGGARADDAIKPGEWQYTTTMHMPNLPQLPPGVRLPPNIQMQTGAGGITVTSTSCVTASDPIAGLNRPHGPRAANMQCRSDRMNSSGGTVSWAGSCTGSDGGTMHMEGTARYDGDRMEADITNRVTPPQGSPIESSLHVTGQYLGPCNGK
ncbi:MAG TPA: DUF3617 domain-containing protein [Stellaceae bacterium]|nr:DUF3617 domain-containing protein [Stellaceae bacterium]